MMKEHWHTLAYDRIGTYKMRLKDLMIKESAITLGKNYCKNRRMEYVGTFLSEEIDAEEEKLRIKLYHS